MREQRRTAPEDSPRPVENTRVQSAQARLRLTARGEVFSYRFYHGWTQTQMAELLGVSDRQVRRWWIEACLRLKESVGNLPVD